MSYFKKMISNLQQQNFKEQEDNQQLFEDTANQRISILQPYKPQQFKMIQSLLPFKIKMLKEIQTKKIKVDLMKSQILKIKQIKEFKQAQLIKESQIINDASRYKSQLYKSSLYRSRRNSSDNDNKMQQMQMELMNRMLNLLEKQKSTNDITTSYKSKQNPIIINNILRDTPHPPLDKSIIQKEIKIKLLQDQRNGYKNRSHYEVNSPVKYQAQRSKDSQDLYQKQLNNLIKAYQCQGNLQNKLAKSNDEYKQEKQQNTRRSLLKKQIQKYSSDKKSEVSLKQSQYQTNSIIHNEFSISKIDKKQIPSPLQSLHNSYLPEQKKHIQKLSNNIEINCMQFVEAPRRMSCGIEEKNIQESTFIQIPVNDNSNQLSLAEAFKRRVGGLSSEKIKIQKNKNINQQLKQKIIENHKNKENKFGHKNKKNKAIGSSRSNHNLQNINGLKMNQSIISKQPGKQLMQRLVNGSRAKITKHQMHELTKKNYEKLPEVKKKKQEQEKKIKQAERLSKIKEYQKQIRSKPSSFCAN